jgi:hypothetical protein
VAVSAFQGLFETMHTTLGDPGLLGNVSHALLRVVTKSVENPKTFGPQSHGVAPSSEGWLKSWSNSALQITGATTNCPGLGGYPNSYTHTADLQDAKALLDALQ